LLFLWLVAGSLAHAQQPGLAHRVGLVFVASPIAQMAGAEPVHPSVGAFVRELP
jgi:hypothetical protein